MQHVAKTVASITPYDLQQLELSKIDKRQEGVQLVASSRVSYGLLNTWARWGKSIANAV